MVCRSQPAFRKRRRQSKILQVNAMVNKVQGKGFEDERNYSGMRFQVRDTVDGYERGTVFGMVADEWRDAVVDTVG